MPISSDELPGFYPLARMAERVTELSTNDPNVYVRLRRKPFGERPKVFGDQIWPAKNNNFFQEILDRIVGSNSSDTILVELVNKGGAKVLDYCEVPPLLEAMEHLMSARFDAAKVQGESQVMIAQTELIGRMVHAMMNERTQFFTAWKESETEGLRIRSELLETQLLSDYGALGDPEDPEAVKWKELGKAFRETMGPAVAPLAKLAALVDQRIAASQQGPQPPNGSNGPNGTSAPLPFPTPAPSPAPVPAPEPGAAPEPLLRTVQYDPATGTSTVTGSAEQPEQPEQPETPQATDDELADATISWLVALLEDAPELLTPDRLAKLAPHRDSLKLAMAVLETIPVPETPVDPPETPADDKSNE